MYTFKREGNNVAIFQDGKRMSTGTADYAKSFGYNGMDTQSPTPIPTAPTPSPIQQPQVQTGVPIASGAPQAPTPGNNLVTFKDTLNQALSIAQQKRNFLATQIAMPLQGKVDANSFSSILDSLNNASNNFVSGQFKQTVSDYLNPEKNKLDTSVVEIAGRKLLINNQTGATIKDLGKATVTGSGGSSNVITDNERALLGNFLSNPVVKNYNDIVAQKNYIDNILAGGVSGPGDLALVYSFMKGLDPNSVVRESEFDAAARSGNIFSGAYAKFNGLFNPEGGSLSPEVKAQFQKLVGSKLKAQQVSYDNLASSFKKIAKNQGLNPENVVPDLGGAVIPQSTTESGRIKVRLQTGQTGTIDVADFDPKTMTKL